MPLTYTVVFREEPEGGYTVLVPALPEVGPLAATLRKRAGEPSKPLS